VLELTLGSYFSYLKALYVCGSQTYSTRMSHLKSFVQCKTNFSWWDWNCCILNAFNGISSVQEQLLYTYLGHFKSCLYGCSTEQNYVW